MEVSLGSLCIMWLSLLKSACDRKCLVCWNRVNYVYVISTRSDMAVITERERKKLPWWIDGGVKFRICVSWLRGAPPVGTQGDGQMAGRVKFRRPCVGLSTMLVIVVFALGVLVGCFFMRIDYFFPERVPMIFPFELNVFRCFFFINCNINMVHIIYIPGFHQHIFPTM